MSNQTPEDNDKLIERRARRGQEYAASAGLRPEEAARKILDKAEELPMDNESTNEQGGHSSSAAAHGYTAPQWRSEAPDEPGWYWTGLPGVSYIVRVWEKGGVLGVGGTEIEDTPFVAIAEYHETGWRWAGPIPEPAKATSAA